MLPNLIQKLTAWLALVLVGLVGGLGTGLHYVFDCCHHPGSSCACCPLDANEVCSANQCDCVFCDARAPSAAEDHLTRGKRQPAHRLGASLSGASLSGVPSSGTSISTSQHDCAICRLLSHYNSTTVQDSPEHYVWASRGIVAISIPAAIPDTSLRLEPSRGPPA